MTGRQSDYEELEASELFCAKCRRSVPVRSRLLLVLPTGNKYDYVCTACGSSVGSKEDGDRTAFRSLLSLAGGEEPRGGPEARRRRG